MAPHIAIQTQGAGRGGRIAVAEGDIAELGAWIKLNGEGAAALSATTSAHSDRVVTGRNPDLLRPR